MSDILFIKTSSLGDVIHHMPALTDARRERPVARFDWVIEEAYAPLARLHPAVNRVIPVATRRWRKGLFDPGVWEEMRDFCRALRAHPYDAIVDTQGLFKSAMIARVAHGPRHGYDSRSIRERSASFFYDVRHTVDFSLHAIERNRRLTGLALGYSSAGEIDYGLDRSALVGAAGDRYGIFLHATARTEKEWPEENWVALGRALSDIDGRLVLPWGETHERARSERIASVLPRASILPRQPLDAVARLIAGAAFVVGVDTGLVHLAAALRVPLVAIFAGSDPGLTGPMGAGPLAVLGAKGSPPAVDQVAAAIRQVMRAG